jgi:carboxylesterase type B
MLAFALVWPIIVQAAIAARSLPGDPLVQLSYGTFRGKYSSAYNISYFLRMPFAAPPTGINRFNAPQPPAPIEGIYDSNRPFGACPSGSSKDTEDCLYLGLYARPWTSSSTALPKLRPVVVFFHGGGFIRGGGSFGLPPSGFPTLDVSAANDFIMVYPNYRLNAFGFLAGKRIKESKNTALNPGLLDQYAVLNWIRSHIRHFGGDPENVAIWGQSAGAGSVVGQVLAQAGRTKSDRLFKKAASSSPFWPRTYAYDSHEAEKQYDRLVNLTGCRTADESLKCLKNLDFRDIQAAAAKMYDDHKYTTSSFNWAPVIDGSFLTESLTSAVKSGRINTELVFGMHNSHEGENFVSGDLKRTYGDLFNSSSAGFDTWLKGFMPKFNKAQVDELRAMYPERGTTDTFAYTSSFERAGLIYRDAVLSCPQLWISEGAMEDGWIGEYTVSPAKHASDVALVSDDIT